VRLMDYSLLVMKIYWKQYAKDNGIQDISLVILNTTQYFRLKIDSQIIFIPFLPHRKMEFITISQLLTTSKNGMHKNELNSTVKNSCMRIESLILLHKILRFMPIASLINWYYKFYEIVRDAIFKYLIYNHF